MAIESTAIASTDTNLLVVPGGKSYAGLTIMVCNTEKIVLEAGDKIVALGESPTNLVATVSFLEV